MQCPSCGLQIDQQNIERCPRCGRMLNYPAAQNTSGDVPDGGGQQGESQQAGGYGTPPTPENPYGVYGGSIPPSGYSQPTAPSYPMAPGYPQPGYPQSPLASQPARKSRTGLIVGVIALVVVVLAACTGGTLFAIHSLGQARVTGTPTPVVSPTLSSTKVYSNTFASNADGWLQDPGHCYLGSDGYHAAAGYYCTAPTVEQDNVDISVKAQQVSGPTTQGYGLVFRLQDKDNFYAFMIVGNGEWVVLRCVNDDCTTPVYFTANDAIKGGLNTINTIKVVATGSHFVFFVNGVTVGDLVDTTFSFGKVGFIAGGTTIDCAFTDLVITRPD